MKENFENIKSDFECVEAYHTRREDVYTYAATFPICGVNTPVIVQVFAGANVRVSMTIGNEGGLDVYPISKADVLYEIIDEYGYETVPDYEYDWRKDTDKVCRSVEELLAGIERVWSKY